VCTSPHTNTIGASIRASITVLLDALKRIKLDLSDWRESFSPSGMVLSAHSATSVARSVAGLFKICMGTAVM